jgi:hypothetical protein
MHTFDTLLDRRGTELKKWDKAYIQQRFKTARKDIYPLFIADMDFPQDEAVLQYLRAFLCPGILYVWPASGCFCCLLRRMQASPEFGPHICCPSPMSRASSELKPIITGILRRGSPRRCWERIRPLSSDERRAYAAHFFYQILSSIFTISSHTSFIVCSQHFHS